MKKNKLFRKAALDKLSSPEQLDQLITVTSPKGWTALFMIGIAIIIALIWGVYGNVYKRVSGQGVLIKTGGIHNITHIASGKISDIRIRVGDVVKKGDVIARIEQTSLLEELKRSREKLVEYQQHLKDISEIKGQKEEFEKTVTDEKIKNLNNSINSLEKRLEFLKERLENQKVLISDGIITKQQVIQTELEIKNVQQDILSRKNQITEVKLSRVSGTKRKKEELNQTRDNIQNMKYTIKELEENFFDSSRVISPFDGRIVEILINENSLIKQGDVMARIELMGKEIKELEAVIYIPVKEGKKVKDGMQVQISPSTVRKEEYGYILARVSKTSEYPVSQTAMMKVLGNEIMVKSMAQQGAPIEIYADLLIDSKNKSGFKWSSRSGPPHKIYSGTVCDVTITVKKQRPITLVIPALKKFFGI